MAKGFEHARGQLVLAVSRSGLAHDAFFVGQLLVQQQGVVPLKSGAVGFLEHF